MMAFIMRFFAMCLVLLLVGCAQRGSGLGSNVVAEHWVNFSDYRLPALEAESSALLIYRPAEVVGEVVTVSINGEYQTSLMPGGVTMVPVCSQPQRIGLAYVAHDAGYVIKRHGGVYYPVQVGEYTYLRMELDQSLRPRLVAVDVAQARQELSDLAYQSHTLSRVQHTCSEPRFVLDASTLFSFDQSSLAHILPGGRDAVRDIAQAVLTYPGGVNKVVVVGHTDPMGSSDYNLRLSERRARSVGDLLVQHGVPASSIHAYGRGDADVLVKDCELLYDDAQTIRECNQPNRRVEVSLQVKP